MRRYFLAFGSAAALLGALSQTVSAKSVQAPPRVVSPEVSADRRVTFRIFAPNAKAVRLAQATNATDIPDVGQTAWLTKAENGVWEITIGPLEAGAYRYTFNVDGVTTLDARNSATSEGFTFVWSVVYVPGSDFFDTKDVPHGSVAKVTYKSSALGYFRRMHVYTPPGYETSRDRYPVLYLLHGATESDEIWSSVGRAGFILDNLIAAKKAKPMIVVMPAGHIEGTVFNGPPTQSAMDRFVTDFNRDLMPYVESHYRVLTTRANTAIAGLSYGGAQTLNVAIPRLERFGWIAVFSSGLSGAFGNPDRRGNDQPLLASEWEARYSAQLSDPALKKALRMWFMAGKEDLFSRSLMPSTVDLLKKHGFAPVVIETGGGHTWINWRKYFADLVPQLFR
jgi:enterochelin esterase family protein